MLELSAVDELIYERFMKEGIFEELKPENIPQTDGAIAVLCSDCDRFQGAVEDLWALSRAWRNNPRTHIFALNGGALWLADDPFATPPLVYANSTNDVSPLTGMEEFRLRFFDDKGKHVVLQMETERIVNAMVSPTLLWHIKQAEEMKGIETLLLNAHAPCGVALNFGWNLEVVASRVLMAAEVVRRRVAGEHDLPIVPVCRVLRGEHEVAHRVNRERFMERNTRR